MKRAGIYKLLLRTLVAPYYEANAGFFFVVIVFAFGLLRPVEHIAVITYTLYAPLLLGMLLALWTLYTLKTIFYTKASLKQPQHTFLHHLSLLPFPNRFIHLLLVQILLWQPVLLYMAFIGYVAFTIHIFTPLYWIALFGVCSITGAALLYNHWLVHPDPDKKQTTLSRIIHTHLTKPYFSFFLSYLLSQQKVLFFLSKLFSTALVIGTVNLYMVEAYHPVLLYLGVLIGISGNAGISFQVQQFEQEQLGFLKNMPVPLPFRFLSLTWVYLILLLPEIAIYIRYLIVYPGWFMILKLILFSLSLLLLFHNYLFTKQLDMELFIRRLFYITLFFFVAILFRVDITWIMLFNFAVSYQLYYRFFYRYERIILPAASSVDSQ